MAHSDRVTNALWMLEALTAAPGHRLSAAEMRRALACTDEELDGYLDLLSTLADRQGGARAIAYRTASRPSCSSPRGSSTSRRARVTYNFLRTLTAA